MYSGKGIVLAIDIGNTNVVIGGYILNELVFSTRLSTDKMLEPDQYALQIKGILELHGIETGDIKGGIMSSVVPQITDVISSAIKTICGIDIILLSHSTNTGIKIDIDSPDELGLDLIAGVLGAKAQYNLPAIVIDMGTATKITAVDGKGVILGCSIMPGVFISVNALTKNASALGGMAVKAPHSKTAIGKNTVHSMQSGVVFGTAAMLDGMIERFSFEMGAKPFLVATGGVSGVIVPHCKNKVVHDNALILAGLNYVFNLLHS